MNKGLKGIVIVLVLVLVLALALGLSACDEPEYYSVSVTSNLTDNPAVQVNVSARKKQKAIRKAKARTSVYLLPPVANTSSKA